MSQIDRLYSLMSDGEPHSTFEIVEKVYDMDTTTIARVGARIFDVKRRFGAYIESYPDKSNKKMWWYRMKKSSPANVSAVGGQRSALESPSSKQGSFFDFKIDQHGHIASHVSNFKPTFEKKDY